MVSTSCFLWPPGQRKQREGHKPLLGRVRESCLGGGCVQGRVQRVGSWLPCVEGCSTQPALHRALSWLRTMLVLQLESNEQIGGAWSPALGFPCVSEGALWWNTNQFVTTANSDGENQQLSSDPGLLTFSKWLSKTPGTFTMVTWC